MPSISKNLGLSIPTGTDTFDVKYWSDNLQKIDDLYTSVNRPSGRASILSTYTFYTVTLGSQQIQADTNYSVLVTPEWNAGAVWISNKSTTGFQINWATNPTVTTALGYQLVR